MTARPQPRFNAGTARDGAPRPGDLLDVFGGPWDLSGRADNTARQWASVDAFEHDLVLVVANVVGHCCVWLPGHGHLRLTRDASRVAFCPPRV